MKSRSVILPVAIRCVDISGELVTPEGLEDYPACRIYVFDADRLLGKVDIQNGCKPVTSMQLADTIAEHFYHRISPLYSDYSGFHPELSGLHEQLGIDSNTDSKGLPPDITASIALATFDRPDQLRECLLALSQQQSPRQLEIIVIDNHPASGKTPPVVAEFPGVTLVSEERQGLAYARNAGFIAAQGDIVIATDEDVVMPPDWAEKMLAPFERSDVGIVTGNVLPRELETESQYLFESYGGLGRGFDRGEYGPDWLRKFKRRAAPTWELGATANAAFRADMFRDPRVGLMDEALGPGMPSGVGEDTLVFYRALKAGYTLIYQPDVYVWHTHRRDHAALRKQIYDYSKGHISYQLTTWLRDGDRRGLFRILVELPRSYIRRIIQRLRGRSDYPVSYILLEIRGNLAGPWGLWRSRQRVQREGRSNFPENRDVPAEQAE